MNSKSKGGCGAKALHTGGRTINWYKCCRAHYGMETERNSGGGRISVGGGGKAKRIMKRSKYEKNITTCA